ncbi:MAG: DUF3277 family protein [Deltaproteobacteria bacterium]|nr:DUF3277 family protein [Deltaproteobacteria bacterium]
MSQNKVASLNPAEVDVIIAGNMLTGFADGTFVDIERDTDTFEDVSGASGEVARGMKNDKRGNITITLMQTSDDNKTLSNLHLADEASGSGTFPSLVKDNSGESFHSGGVCWIKKPAKAGYSKGVETREWTIRVAHLITHVAGNADIS